MDKKNVYLEVGAYSLRWINAFLRENPDKEWEIHIFEPASMFNRKIRRQIRRFGLKGKAHFYPFAVFNENVEKEFHFCHRLNQGSTLFTGKTHNFKYEKSEIVKCIDFNQWILENLNKDDYIYMNMDIEGSEYYVLPHLIKNGTIDYFDDLKIEFHSFKFAGENREKFDKIHLELVNFFIRSDKFDISKFTHF